MSENKIEEKELRFVQDVFLSFFADQENRLARGTQLREEMHASIANGEKPTGYRADWIKASALRVVSLLQTVAGEFNDSHLDDRCSSVDLLDVLATVNALFGRG